MSEFRVPVTKIRKLEVHPNEDKLSLAKVFDFDVVVQRHRYFENSTVIYIPIDSILPSDIESKIFGEDSKVRLHKSRVRQIRLRGAVSQGMVVDPELLGLSNLTEGDCVAALLGITKFEPPAPDFDVNQPRVKKERNKTYENPYFHQYGGLQNIKFYPDMFVDGQEVIYQEKIHGSNVRFGILPQSPKTLWQKFLKYIGKFAEYQFCYGSNTVQRQHDSKKNTATYYGEDIYAQMAVKYQMQNKLFPNETVYAEIYGPGIQKHYEYGQSELQIVVFDVKVLAADQKSNQWLTPDQVKEFCKQRGLPAVPELYRGPHSSTRAKEATEGVSAIDGKTVKEGIVIRDPRETECYAGKKFFKMLSEEYLDNKHNTDFH